MNSRSVLDWIITPFLAVATAGLLFTAGCQSADDHGAATESAETREHSASEESHRSMPDPTVPQGENLERPEGWVVRLDQPDPQAVIGSADTADIFFVNMTPGWHITAHKSAIYYHPASMAHGDYTASAKIYFFNPGDRHREGYGMIFGGTELDGDSQAYGYFLLRNTGDFLIKQRSGAETSVVQDWTDSDAIRVVSADDEESVLNELSVRVEGDQVHFAINGENVATHPASVFPTDGIVGLRLNHGVNVHVADVSVER